MTSYSNKTVSPITSLKILQLNCHRSPAVFHSLFNDPETEDRHVLMIQEPATYPQSGLPMANPRWTQYLPSQPPPLDPDHPLSAPRYRCVTYINKNIQSHRISQANSRSCLVVALKILPSPNSTPLHLINAYLPPAHQNLSQTLLPALSQASPGPVLLGMDSNIHHPTWNPPSYSHSHQESEDLILLAATIILPYDQN